MFMQRIQVRSNRACEQRDILTDYGLQVYEGSGLETVKISSAHNPSSEIFQAYCRDIYPVDSGDSVS